MKYHDGRRAAQEDEEKIISTRQETHIKEIYNFLEINELILIEIDRLTWCSAEAFLAIEIVDKHRC